ncbi:MAG: hypothetical protein C4B59_07500 [Candidatus Methanogaster sp.]|uniref:Uncharacterized protein n=1 Tax=Candidatus Methanogaster sp. TaxID=3386292 RepID=A0AC61L3A6_9EURY|nr:MAG: hypothetical protein C4B59_07500 [ANME-2 cluster archaeon]
MDTEIINQHLKWIESIESEYQYALQESGEFDAFFEVAGRVSGVLAAILHKAGSKIDEKLEL